MVLTIEERERRAYIEGRAEEARLLAQILDQGQELVSRELEDWEDEGEDEDEDEDETHRLRDILEEIALLCRRAL